MNIQELVLDFVNVKGQELSGKVVENQSIEADLQQINDMWNSVQELVSERTKDLRRIIAELSDFKEDLGRLGDVLNYTEVCLHESETTKVPGYNGLQNQLAKLKVSLRVQCKFRLLCCSSVLRRICELLSSTTDRNYDLPVHDLPPEVFRISQRFVSLCYLAILSFPGRCKQLRRPHGSVNGCTRTRLAPSRALQQRRAIDH